MFESVHFCSYKIQQTIVKPKSKSLVPNPSPKSMSRTHVPNAKSKVQRKGTGTGADIKILWATRDKTRPSMTFLDLPWLSMTFNDLLWPSITFYHLLRPLWLYMIKCLLSRGLTLSTPNLLLIFVPDKFTKLSYNY